MLVHEAMSEMQLPPAISAGSAFDANASSINCSQCKKGLVPAEAEVKHIKGSAKAIVWSKFIDHAHTSVFGSATDAKELKL